MILVGPPRKAPPNYHHSPERGKSTIGVYPQHPQAVIPLPDPAILDTHFGYPLASADATTKPSNDGAHTHFEFSTAPLSPKFYFRRFNATNTLDSPVWKNLQNSRRVFEEFEWHLRCVARLFFSLLAAIFRLWQFAAWHIFSCASQAFLVRILIAQLSTVWSAMVPIFRHSAPVWIVSIVDFTVGFALEADEVPVELARCANNGNDQGFDGSKNASIPVKTVEIVEVSTATITVVRSSAYGEKQRSEPHVISQ
ncbi:hypothetical protein V8E53_009278 [Lactarius tabidus]